LAALAEDRKEWVRLVDLRAVVDRPLFNIAVLGVAPGRLPVGVVREIVGPVGVEDGNLLLFLAAELDPVFDGVREWEFRPGSLFLVLVDRD
jgi:hypothetical protein